jgi:hypothetical protein
LRDELQPLGAFKVLLVDRIISSTRRLQRLGRVETGIFAFELYGELAERAEREARSYESNMLVAMSDPLDTITDEQKHQEALSRA